MVRTSWLCVQKVSDDPCSPHQLLLDARHYSIGFQYSYTLGNRLLAYKALENEAQNRAISHQCGDFCCRKLRVGGRRRL